MLELKLQYFGHLVWRTDSLKKPQMLVKIECRRRKGMTRKRCLDVITDSMDMSWTSSGSYWWTGKPGMLQSMWSKSLTWLSDWTELPVNIQSGFPLGSTGWFPYCPRVFSSTTVWSISSLVLSLLYGPTLTSVHDYWKNHSFDNTELCWQSDVSAS